MRFETEQDRINEYRIMDCFSCGHPFKKLGNHDVDFVVPGRCYVEIKAKKFRHDKYPAQLISLIKIVKLQERSRELPAFLVFGFTDCILYIKVEDIKGYVKWSGRKQRKGATNDRELCLFIDVNNMTKMPINYELIDSDNQLK